MKLNGEYNSLWFLSCILARTWFLQLSYLIVAPSFQRSFAKTEDIHLASFAIEMQRNLFLCTLLMVCLARSTVRYFEWKWTLRKPLSIQIGKQCLNDQWPPKPDRILPTYVINLDAPPVERWQNVTALYKTEVRQSVDTMRSVCMHVYK